MRVFQYNWTADQYVQLGSDVLGEKWYNVFGWFVALSADGMIMAAGARYNDNENGQGAGHVHLF